MKNIKVTLDCISGILTIHLKGQEIMDKIKLNPTPWTSISVGKKGKIYELRFIWNEDSYLLPKIEIYPIKSKKYTPNKTVEVEIIRGCKEDFFGKKFVGGYQSWMSTFYVMGREIDGIKGYDEVVGRRGSTYFFSEVPIWVDEFESTNKDKEWDGEFEDLVIDFLTLKIKDLCL